MEKGRRRAREVAREFIERGEPTGWFEALYSIADGDASQLPWADLAANPYLKEWLPRVTTDGHQRALIVGCGLGDDAEAVAALGFATVAFDISATAIEWCRRRFPNSPVEYLEADLVNPPETWHNGFESVLESSTLQVLPPELRCRATQQLAKLLVPGGRLLVLARRRDPGEDLGTAPWTMLKEDLDLLLETGLLEVSFEEFLDKEDPSVRRFRAEYRKG